MKARSIVLALMLTMPGFATACGESAAGPAVTTTATDLVGRWIGPRDGLAPEAWHQSTLTFTIDGRFAFENRTHGIYEGESAEVLSVISRVEGTFRIAGDRLIFKPQRLVWWDRFHGASSPEHVEDPYPWRSIFDDARFSIAGDHLTISYIVNPADAPMLAVSEYTRER